MLSHISHYKHWLLDILLLTIVLIAFYSLFMGSYPLFTPDEGRYSEVAREMLTNQDYITPRLNGIVFLDKPILYYWLQAFSIKVFGLNEWSLRVWPVSFGILGCLMTYIAGMLLFNRRTAILSTIILATAPMYFSAAHYANLDLEVAVLISASLLCFIGAAQIKNHTSKTFLLLCVFIFSALAALTKGLIGIFFPASIGGTWILLQKRWDLFKNPYLFLGAFLFLCIALPWYFLVQIKNPEFFHFFFVTQQMARFLSSTDFNNKTTWWFYIPIILIGLIPWSPFIIQAIFKSLSTIYKKLPLASIHSFLILWVLIVFLFFSFPRSKTIGYILPLFPALALLIGNYFSTEWETLNERSLLFGKTLSVLFFIIIAISFWFFPNLHLIEITAEIKTYLHFLSVLSLSVALFLVLIPKKSFIGFFVVISTSSMLFLLSLAMHASLFNTKSITPLTDKLKPILQPNDEVVTYYKYYQDLPLYLEKRIAIVADWEASDIASNDNWLRELWYGMHFKNSIDTKRWLINEHEFWRRWSEKKRVFVFLNQNYLDTFKAQAKYPYYTLAQSHDIILISNKLSSSPIPKASHVAPA